MKRLVLILTMTAGLVSSALGQGVQRGTVSGRVTDANGAAVARARVMVTSDVVRSYKTIVTAGDAGDFSVPDVPEGAVSASAITANGVVRATAKGTLSKDNLTAVVSIKIPAGK